jgi:hypothetical protein
LVIAVIGFSDIRKVVSWRNEVVTRTEKGEDGELASQTLALLRARRQRPRSRKATERTEKFAPSHVRPPEEGNGSAKTTIPAGLAGATYAVRLTDVRVGSHSVIRRCRLNVRITPESGPQHLITACRMSATNEHPDQLNC